MIFIALLRAVNVGGRGKVAMADLRALCVELGLNDPRSLLQSGNLVFDAAGKSAALLETLLERETARALGVETEYLVRSAAEWRELVKRNPFPDEAEADPSHLLAVCLKTAPKAAGVAALQGAIKGRERVAASGKHLYAVYPDGIGNSKLTMPAIESRLGARGTGRNWNTVLKLLALT
jgi:uncharacterized protein (DUF1697 family)